ncbi:unnamed protein product [Ceratitis capitata]|uniref:(Mediterranean fruit fly) hypothetical protein n=1 Tax=Ceratitis capitata TaxID=7213 RepID=A0A811UA70_CERCA|nr:unnamed protein product [Ceratitis capitata]
MHSTAYYLCKRTKYNSSYLENNSSCLENRLQISSTAGSVSKFFKMDIDCVQIKNSAKILLNFMFLPTLHYFRPAYAPYSPYVPCPPHLPNRLFPHECNWSCTGKGDRVIDVVGPMAKPPQQVTDKSSKDLINHVPSNDEPKEQHKDKINGEDSKNSLTNKLFCCI